MTDQQPAAEVVVLDEVKTGGKTTEFWALVGVLLLSVVEEIHRLSGEAPAGTPWALIGAGLASVGYSTARAWVKAAVARQRAPK